MFWANSWEPWQQRQRSNRTMPGPGRKVCRKESPESKAEISLPWDPGSPATCPGLSAGFWPLQWQRGQPEFNWKNWGHIGDFLVVQWPKLCVPNSGGPDLISGKGTRSYMSQWRSKVLSAATKPQHSQIYIFKLRYYYRLQPMGRKESDTTERLHFTLYHCYSVGSSKLSIRRFLVYLGRFLVYFGSISLSWSLADDHALICLCILCILRDDN